MGKYIPKHQNFVARFLDLNFDLNIDINFDLNIDLDLEKYIKEM